MHVIVHVYTSKEELVKVSFCDSVTFTVSGGPYSSVCSQLKKYHYKIMDAFEAKTG